MNKLKGLTKNQAMLLKRALEFYLPVGGANPEVPTDRLHVEIKEDRDYLLGQLEQIIKHYEREAPHCQICHTSVGIKIYGPKGRPLCGDCAPNCGFREQGRKC